jgi:hypothetical protein
VAQITAEQLLNKVQAQAGRIVQLELMLDAMTVENAELNRRVDELLTEATEAEIKDVAAEITAEGKK